MEWYVGKALNWRCWIRTDWNTVLYFSFLDNFILAALSNLAKIRKPLYGPCLSGKLLLSRQVKVLFSSTSGFLNERCQGNLEHCWCSSLQSFLPLLGMTGLSLADCLIFSLWLDTMWKVPWVISTWLQQHLSIMTKLQTELVVEGQF